MPFRYQFLLAPLGTVIVLVLLVSYTLYELANINRENAISRDWELRSDRLQSGLVALGNLNRIIENLQIYKGSARGLEEDELFFSFLEQSRLVVDNLYDPVLYDGLESSLKNTLDSKRGMFNKPEQANMPELQRAISELLPKLEHHNKILTAQRRSSFIDNHRHLVQISSRMTYLLLVGLIACIALATVLAFWGVHRIRSRLNRLSRYAHGVCEGDNTGLPAPEKIIDELDDLEQCLSDMTHKLLHAVRIDNVLYGVEMERKRIAMDMHDGVLADLTMINRLLDKLEAGEEQVRPDKIRSEVNEIIAGLRQTIDDLHPQLLDTLGLESALRSYLERHLKQNSKPRYRLQFDASIEELLGQKQKIHLFRILTEAIHNVLRHARAEQMEVSLVLVNNRIICSVEDNGLGMPQDFPVDGHGCNNIIERANLIGANCEWGPSRFSGGTMFRIELAVNSLCKS